nr:Chain C, As64 [Foot-and-mouth disease virus]8GQV_F Chain F, As64 [Foot-and-mouth disease virus]
ALLRSATYY